MQNQAYSNDLLPAFGLTIITGLIVDRAVNTLFEVEFHKLERTQNEVAALGLLLIISNCN